MRKSDGSGQLEIGTATGHGVSGSRPVSGVAHPRPRYPVEEPAHPKLEYPASEPAHPSPRQGRGKRGW